MERKANGLNKNRSGVSPFQGRVGFAIRYAKQSAVKYKKIK